MSNPPGAGGRVRSLHIHPPMAGEPMPAFAELNLVADQGIREDRRYFARGSAGKPAKRQVSLIEREMVQRHADALGLPVFDPGAVRSNIETEGADLIAWIGREVLVGEATLRFVEARTPCHKMDTLAPGLRGLMENNSQGVIATVLKSGRVRVGDPISLVPRETD